MQSRQSGIFTNDRCVGCNRCISVCPLPEANYAAIEDGGNKIYVNAEACIGCGKCLDACQYGARDYLDDTEQFLARLGSGKISVVASPTIRTGFSGYEHMLGLLRSLGVKYIYDSSLGADICAWSYIRRIQKTGVTGLISQICPAVVNYIEKYACDLIPLLTPIYSPAVCTAVYMRRYRGIGGEIAFLSPCAVTKNEFSDPNTGGAIRYNVTFRNLAKALKTRGINYLQSPKSHFDNEEHGLGPICPMPGGLGPNLRRTVPDAWIYQVEGQPGAKRFLDGYSGLSDTAKPFLVDILSCPGGCTGGCGTFRDGVYGLTASRIMHEAWIEAAADRGGIFRKQKSPGKTLEELDRLLNPEDFARSYTPKPVSSAPISRQQIKAAFKKLGKTTPESQRSDCGACGYPGCAVMASAIAKGINQAENCVQYRKGLLEGRQEEIQTLLEARERQALELESALQDVYDFLSQNTEKTGDALRQLAQACGEIAALRESIRLLNQTADALKSNFVVYPGLSDDLTGISTLTKMLSKNASVEAVYAGDAGKGFSVVAGELNRLSEQSTALAKEFASGNVQSIPLLDEALACAKSLEARAESITVSTQSLLDAVNSLDQIGQNAAESAGQALLNQPALV